MFGIRIWYRNPTLFLCCAVLFVCKTLNGEGPSVKLEVACATSSPNKLKVLHTKLTTGRTLSRPII